MGILMETHLTHQGMVKYKQNKPCGAYVLNPSYECVETFTFIAGGVFLSKMGKLNLMVSEKTVLLATNG